MIILVINCGSSSIKYQLYKMPTKEVLAKGLVEKIGEETSRIKHSTAASTKSIEETIADHKAGLKHIVQLLTDKEVGVISNMSDIKAVGHRVVHGGEAYSKSVVIDNKVIKSVKEVADLAPLHNPPNLTGITEAKTLLPNVPMVAVFDTAFHQTLPKVSYTYALPFEFYEKFKIRRYGFHGTSHAYVANRASELLNIPMEKFNLITCHLGNGCSMAAIKNGKSIDTTMGLTPLEGLVMGTRCGDIDPAIIFYLLGKEGYNDPKKLDTILNKKSGLLGISGKSNDLRNLTELAKKEGINSRAQLALDIFCYKLKKTIGAYMASLGRTDAIVFTGGIGENAISIRANALADFEFAGISLDREKNNTTTGKEGEISSSQSKVKIMVIPTDEEGWIASDTYDLCKN